MAGRKSDCVWFNTHCNQKRPRVRSPFAQSWSNLGTHEWSSPEFSLNLLHPEYHLSKFARGQTSQKTYCCIRVWVAISFAIICGQKIKSITVPWKNVKLLEATFLTYNPTFSPSMSRALLWAVFNGCFAGRLSVGGFKPLVWYKCGKGLSVCFAVTKYRAGFCVLDVIIHRYGTFCILIIQNNILYLKPRSVFQTTSCKTKSGVYNL